MFILLRDMIKVLENEVFNELWNELVLEPFMLQLWWFYYIYASL